MRKIIKEESARYIDVQLNETLIFYAFKCNIGSIESHNENVRRHKSANTKEYSSIKAFVNYDLFEIMNGGICEK